MYGEPGGALFIIITDAAPAQHQLVWALRFKLRFFTDIFCFIDIFLCQGIDLQRQNVKQIVFNRNSVCLVDSFTKRNGKFNI